ncbi:matrixin [Actinomadura pelletieri DSM 43383]|uniref:Matrixin n=2 Tax=Actinomadura pelletieri TaxID=111805 RepID=A0A495R028_9ACTN|nr:matrixin [Actinomadura pelletieri DSM 43383]
MHGISRAARAGVVPAVMTAAFACALTAAGGVATAADNGPRRPPGWCKPGGTLSIRAMPQKIRIAQCDLRGRTVRGADGLTAVVPTDGSSLIAHSLRTGGSSALTVRFNRRAGEIILSMRGAHVPQGRPRAAQAPLNACQDGTYSLEPSKWATGSAVPWRYHPGTTGLPSSVIAEGVANMVNGNTDCTGRRRFTPPPNVDARYLGQSATGPNVTNTATCAQRDRVNTFGWRSMTGANANILAATCIWYSGSRTLESDMALQQHGKRWWTGGTCRPGGFSVEAVATHEAGHVFGLAHVAGSRHSALTMAPSVAACDSGPATLGRGDHAGLLALYGGR